MHLSRQPQKTLGLQQAYAVNICLHILHPISSAIVRCALLLWQNLICIQTAHDELAPPVTVDQIRAGCMSVKDARCSLQAFRSMCQQECADDPIPSQ